MITWSDFEKLDIRTGTIVEVHEFPEAIKPAWKLKIDFGALGVKQSSAQIKANYSKEDLIGKQVLAVLNFPPKQIANFMSECLVLGLPDEEGKVVLIKPDKQVKNGVKLY